MMCAPLCGQYEKTAEMGHTLKKIINVVGTTFVDEILRSLVAPNL